MASFVQASEFTNPQPVIAVNVALEWVGKDRNEGE